MVATARTISLLLPLLAGGVASFSIVSVSEHAAPYTAGDTVQLVCRADGWWEYCSWTHGDTQCDLEWKYATSNVTKQECHSKLTTRVSIAGDYNNHECSIRIKNVDIGDAGTWKCKMESYVSGIGRGYTKTRSQVIAIAEKTTTTEAATESTTTETSTTTTMTTTTTTTAPATTTTTTTLANDIIDKEIEEESQSPEDTLYLDDEAKDDAEDGSTVEALPVSDREAARSDGSIGVISGVIVSLLAVVVIMTVLGVKLYRRRKSHQAIISYLQSERDDAMATNSFLEEAEYHISIIRDPQALPLAVTSPRPSDILDNSVTEVLTVSETKET